MRMQQVYRVSYTTRATYITRYVRIGQLTVGRYFFSAQRTLFFFSTVNTTYNVITIIFYKVIIA